MQRWVSEVAKDGTNWELLDAILRAARQSTFETSGLQPTELRHDGRLRMFEPWAPVPAQEDTEIKREEIDQNVFKIVTTEKRWKGVRDLNIYACERRILGSRPPTLPAVGVHQLPFVEGAFLLSDVLSTSECDLIISAAESMGFVPDAEYTMNADRTSGTGRAAFGAVWLASDQMISELYGRILPHLPPSLAGGAVAGLNARLRLYRYESGAVYRPHVDGAWPGSGLVDGQYAFDAFGDRWSRLTCLIYLNEGFEGGSTTFFGPSAIDGVVDGRGVLPRKGSVLFFPHGDTGGALVHEGSEVTKGAKYVIRTDVLYYGKQQPSAASVAGRALVEPSDPRKRPRQDNGLEL